MMTAQMKHHRKTIRLRRITEFWNNSLVVIALLGILLLLSSCFIRRLEMVLIFGQMLAIIALASLSFFCFMLFLKGCGRSKSVVMIGLGSGGLLFGFLSQLVQNQVMDKPSIINIAITMLCIGCIILLNKFYYHATDIRR